MYSSYPLSLSINELTVSYILQILVPLIRRDPLNAHPRLIQRHNHIPRQLARLIHVQISLQLRKAADGK